MQKKINFFKFECIFLIYFDKKPLVKNLHFIAYNFNKSKYLEK